MGIFVTRNDSNIHNEPEKATNGNDNSADSKSVVVVGVTEQQQPLQQSPPTQQQQQQQQQHQQPQERYSQTITGVKRSLPTSPELAQPDSGTPLAKHHRGPLLPNPDTPIMFGRSGAIKLLALLLTL